MYKDWCEVIKSSRDTINDLNEKMSEMEVNKNNYLPKDEAEVFKMISNSLRDFSDITEYIENGRMHVVKKSIGRLGKEKDKILEKYHDLSSESVEESLLFYFDDLCLGYFDIVRDLVCFYDNLLKNSRNRCELEVFVEDLKYLVEERKFKEKLCDCGLSTMEESFDDLKKMINSWYRKVYCLTIL